MESWIIWVVIALVAVLLVGLYNRIVALIQRRKNAFSDSQPCRNGQGLCRA
jgi:hypothetical protein